MPTWNPSDPSEPATSAGGRPETAPAHQALLDYMYLCPRRTFPDLLNQYLPLNPAPTHSHGTLRAWSSQYDWASRDAVYGDLENQRLQAEVRARREAIFQRGLALDFERIQHLTALFDKLEALVTDGEAFWIKDVRLLHFADGSTERVDLPRFNGALVRNLRDLLEDIASETGGRAHRVPLQDTEEPAQNMDDFPSTCSLPKKKPSSSISKTKSFQTLFDPIFFKNCE